MTQPAPIPVHGPTRETKEIEYRRMFMNDRIPPSNAWQYSDKIRRGLDDWKLKNGM